MCDRRTDEAKIAREQDGIVEGAALNHFSFHKPFALKSLLASATRRRIGEALVAQAHR
jgi:hypothetical protein